MNLIQMGLCYSTDRQGRTKLVKMTQQEQEAAMKNRKAQHAQARYAARKAQEAAQQQRKAA